MKIQLEDLGKTFRPDIQAVAGVCLSIPSSECVTIVGPSGCGKTTLLRLIAGLQEPTTGSVFLDDRDVTRANPSERGVALAFQRPALVAGKSVRQNLLWPGLLRCASWRPSESERRKLDAVATLLGLTGVLDRRAEQLSGGQQQRVALGRMLLRDARVWLLDEPLAHLDAPLRRELQREMRLLSKAILATMVYVTHDPAEALAAGDRVAVMRAGRIEQVDTAEAVVHTPANRFVAELFAQEMGGLSTVDGTLVETATGQAFDGPWGRWALPRGWGRLNPATPEITLGFGASDLRLAGDDRRGVRFETTAVLIEKMAQGRRVVCGDERGRFTAMIPSTLVFQIGQPVMLHVSLTAAFCFERSGKTLRVPTG